MTKETTLNLSGTYSEAGFAAALGLDVGVQLMDGAKAALLKIDTPTVLIWHKFHGASVGTRDSDALAQWLRDIAHDNHSIRLVFFDEEGAGQ